MPVLEADVGAGEVEEEVVVAVVVVVAFFFSGAAARPRAVFLLFLLVVVVDEGRGVRWRRGCLLDTVIDEMSAFGVRWMMLSCSSSEGGKCRVSKVGWDGMGWDGMRCDIPVHRRHGGSELVLGLPPLHELDARVDAARLLEGRDASAHPGRTAGELVVGGDGGPVEGVLQRHESVHCAYGLAMQERRGQARNFDDAMPVAPIGLLGGLHGPRSWEVRFLRLMEIARVLIEGVKTDVDTFVSAGLTAVSPLHW